MAREGQGGATLKSQSGPALRLSGLCLIALVSGTRERILFPTPSSHEPTFTKILLISISQFVKAMTKLDSILKSRNITLPTKVCIVKAMVFPAVMSRCESWTTKKAEL